MHTAPTATATAPSRLVARSLPAVLLHALPRALLRTSPAVGALLLCGAANAVDFGPFSLTGFAKVEWQHGDHHCPDCQRFPDENKQRQWADELIPGRAIKTEDTVTTLFQPYLGAKFVLGRGFTLSGLLSQRLRDGKVDIPGFLYEANVALSHEDYGSLRVGKMTTRTWAVADYPYGTNIGVADAWGSAGAGYGLLTNAIRYTARPLDVFQGDLVLEATYDRGDTGFKRNKPQFWEFYAQYHRGDLVIDAMYQDARNGNPQSWSHGPFTGLTPFPENDAKLGGSGQSIALVMARYQINASFEVSGGARRNRWSGAYAVITTSVAGQPDQWNNMFNVDWADSRLPGYGTHSYDWMLGLRYRTGAWTASTGIVHLGKASTANPSDRGQKNSATFNTLGLYYEFGHGLQFYGLAGMVRYDQLGLAPMSMPSNSAFSQVDSRVSKSGTWFGAGAVYVF